MGFLIIMSVDYPKLVTIFGLESYKINHERTFQGKVSVVVENYAKVDDICYAVIVKKPNPKSNPIQIYFTRTT